jgi:LemA protein
VIILGGMLLAIFGWAVWSYNRLVRDRHRVAAAWSDIDVQLKRRHELLPKLVEAVRGYADYERATLEAVTELRARSRQTDDPALRGRLEADLGAGMRRLLALAEAYPELKAGGNFLALQRDISDVENALQHARRYYNGAVRNLNTRIDSFPDLLLARALRYRYGVYFQLDEDLHEAR